MGFVKVTATQCNSQGLTSPQVRPVEILLNVDLIGAIKGQEVLLKGGNILSLGSNFYTAIKLAPNVTIPTI